MSGISPELLQLVEQESHPGNSWDAYAILLRYLQQAIDRVPPPETIEDIDEVFVGAMEHLATTLAEIFPGEGGVEELCNYLPKTEEDTPRLLSPRRANRREMIHWFYQEL